MSKRARITLDLDQEPAETESLAAATPKPASKGAAMTESRPAKNAPPASKAKAKSKPRAKPKAKPKVAAASKQGETRVSETRSSARPQAHRASDPEAISDVRQTSDVARRPYVSAASSAQAGSGLQKDPAKAAQPSAPPPGMFDLGAALKVGVVAVGVIVVSVVWWLKRKP